MFFRQSTHGVNARKVMIMDRFSLSIKGVLAVDDEFLLRKNERSEYELLGGHLEKDDPSVEYRLITEFAEESGIEIKVSEHREPWLYEVGLKNIIIVPYVCHAVRIPDTLVDGDGGTLHWIKVEDIPGLFMPQGYKDTITGAVPYKSYSVPAKQHFKAFPDYIESDYTIDVCVKEHGRELLRMPLPHFHSPRDFIYRNLGEKSKDIKLTSEPISIDRNRDTITLNYTV